MLKSDMIEQTNSIDAGKVTLVAIFSLFLMERPNMDPQRGFLCCKITTNRTLKSLTLVNGSIVQTKIVSTSSLIITYIAGIFYLLMDRFYMGSQMRLLSESFFTSFACIFNSHVH